MRVLLSVLAYVAATFVTQGVSHLVVNRAHYGAVGHLRRAPIFPLGIGSMIVQGVILAYLFPRSGFLAHPWGALGFAWLTGGLLVSYIALAEAGKYTVPSIPRWIVVEVAAGLVQFTAFGLLLRLIYRAAGEPAVAVALLPQ